MILARGGFTLYNELSVKRSAVQCCQAVLVGEALWASPLSPQASRWANLPTLSRSWFLPWSTSGLYMRVGHRSSLLEEFVTPCFSFCIGGILLGLVHLL